MARVTPEQAADKWKNRLSGATQEITNGVMGVQRAPGLAAAAAKDVWLARTTASANKWAKRVSSVSLQDWQTKMRDVGIPRIAQGAAANQPKMAQFMSEFLPHVDAVAKQVRAMPNATLEDGVNRAIAQIRGNAKFQRGGGTSAG